MSTPSQFTLNLEITSIPCCIIPPGHTFPERVFVSFTINGYLYPSQREWLIFEAKFIPVVEEPELTGTSLSSDNVPELPIAIAKVSNDNVRNVPGTNHSVSFKISAPTERGIYRLQVSAVHSRPDNDNSGSILSPVGDAVVSTLIHVEDRESRLGHFRRWLRIGDISIQVDTGRLSRVLNPHEHG